MPSGAFQNKATRYGILKERTSKKPQRCAREYWVAFVAKFGVNTQSAQKRRIVHDLCFLLRDRNDVRVKTGWTAKRLEGHQREHPTLMNTVPDTGGSERRRNEARWGRPRRRRRGPGKR